MVAENSKTKNVQKEILKRVGRHFGQEMNTFLEAMFNRHGEQAAGWMYDPVNDTCEKTDG